MLMILYFLDHLAASPPGLREARLGSSPHRCTHVGHAQLGDGAQEVGASLQGDGHRRYDIKFRRDLRLF